MIDWADVAVDQSWFVGEGGFGKVFKGQWASNAIAVKFLSGAFKVVGAVSKLQHADTIQRNRVFFC